MTHTDTLRAEIEATAKLLKVSPSTIGERAGQGGQFYKRLQQGKRVWPETADKVRKTMQALLSESECDKTHGNTPSAIQGKSEDKPAQVAS